ncbi:MAG: NYN domain-containing protein [Clostridia bacterium]|nr:NYN domain-containing protein [Clostridia bacterium]
MNIALFIDIDNAKVTLPVFNNILQQLRNRGKLSFVKVYGFNERKHIRFGEVIEENGFDTAPTMRFKKRAKSQLDTRIIIDSVKLFYTSKHIDEYCFVTGVGDLVPLLSFLRAGGKSLITIQSDTIDGNDHMYDSHLVLDVAYTRPSKLSKTQLNAKIAAISKRSQALADADTEDNDANKQRIALIREIEELLEEKPDDLDEEEEEMFSSLESLLEILKI